MTVILQLTTADDQSARALLSLSAWSGVVEKYPARWAWTSDLFSDFWKYLNSNYNESIASNIIMKQFSETTKIKTTLILSTRTQLSDISSVQMKLFLVKLNFLNLKKVNVYKARNSIWFRSNKNISTYLPRHLDVLGDHQGQQQYEEQGLLFLIIAGRDCCHSIYSN